ncbi:MAG: aminodeoxychorismate/anthranilate synthase component II [Clostridiales bacterium GWB2_37_7]|nr:MAG: aminodeoxychorismate/anthranilate synthase component II [Clostridiales bacterium GWB2_37_7]
MILMIDNYDSFTYNLVQYLQMLGQELIVCRNDSITLKDIEEMKPKIIVISPGPCSPDEAGISLSLVEAFKGKIPILGICLGHQTIGQVFGARVVKAVEPVHGKVHEITHSNKGVFKGLSNPLKVTRYHSLVLESDTLPSCLEVTAETGTGEIMGIMHKEYAIEGVQFHPEAYLTEQGLELLDNFIKKYI